MSNLEVNSSSIYQAQQNNSQPVRENNAEDINIFSNDGDDGLDGEDGIKVVSSNINENGDQILEYSDGTMEDSGHVTGTDGQNGTTITISADGTWVLDGEDTGLAITGGDGDRGITIDENGDLIFAYNDGTIENAGHVTGTDGQDGTTITISENGTWVLDGEDTGLSITGEDGEDGKSLSAIHIDENGDWALEFDDGTIESAGHVLGNG